VVGSTSIAVGWLNHFFNGALIGAIFGWLIGARAVSVGRGLAWGAGYGLGWAAVAGVGGGQSRDSRLRHNPSDHR
jgi:hypothetical protein